MAAHSSILPVDRGAWWATVHRVAESDTTDHVHTHTHTHTKDFRYYPPSTLQLSDHLTWRPYTSVSLTVSLKVSFKVVIMKHVFSP